MRLVARLKGRPTALIVPVPEAVGVRPGSTAALPPHVTVLYPFRRSRAIADGDHAALAEIAAATPAFAFALERVERFPGDVLYLAPEPAAPFIALTEAVAARWPDHQPFAGAHDDIVPHVTLAVGPEPAGLADRAQATLPIASRADALWLVDVGEHGWKRRATFPLGGGR